MAKLSLEQWAENEKQRRTGGLQERIVGIRRKVDAQIARVLADAAKAAEEMGIDPNDSAKTSRLFDMSLRAAGIVLDVPDEAPLYSEDGNATERVASSGDQEAGDPATGNQRQGGAAGGDSGSAVGRPEENGVAAQPGNGGKRHGRRKHA